MCNSPHKPKMYKWLFHEYTPKFSSKTKIYTNESCFEFHIKNSELVADGAYLHLQILHFTAAFAVVPARANLLTICHRSHSNSRAIQRFLAGHQTNSEMPSVGNTRVRSGSAQKDQEQGKGLGKADYYNSGNRTIFGYKCLYRS